MRATVATILASTQALCAGVEGQVPIWTRQGTPLPTLMLLGGRLGMVGDVNGDGYDDLIQDVGSTYPMYGLWVWGSRAPASAPGRCRSRCRSTASQAASCSRRSTRRW